MIRAKFEGWLSRSNTNGGQFWCPGEYTVYVERIPADAPQDWNTGPKQTPGKWGAYLEHLWYPAKHGHYAFAVASTEIDAAAAAKSYFRERMSEWERIGESANEIAAKRASTDIPETARKLALAATEGAGPQ